MGAQLQELPGENSIHVGFASRLTAAKGVFVLHWFCGLGGANKLLSVPAQSCLCMALDLKSARQCYTEGSELKTGTIRT